MFGTLRLEERIENDKVRLSLHIGREQYSLPDFYVRDLHFNPSDYEKHLSDLTSRFPEISETLRSHIRKIYSGDIYAPRKFIETALSCYSENKMTESCFQVYMNIFTRASNFDKVTR